MFLEYLGADVSCEAAAVFCLLTGNFTDARDVNGLFVSVIPDLARILGENDARIVSSERERVLHRDLNVLGLLFVCNETDPA